MDLMVRDMIIITMVLEVNDVTIAFRFLFKELAGSWRSLQKFFLFCIYFYEIIYICRDSRALKLQPATDAIFRRKFS